MTTIKTSSKRPRDPARLAKLVVDLSVEAADKGVTTSGAVTSKPQQPVRGQAGGLKGGPARAEALNREQRQEIAKKAADGRGRKRSMDR